MEHTQALLRVGVVVAITVALVACSDNKDGDGTGLDIQASLDATFTEVVETDEGPPPGTCLGASNGSPCDDLDPCTVDDVCDSGVCVGGSNKVCDAGGPCQAGTCEPDTGQCTYEVVADGTACSVTCFDEAVCEAGSCKPQGAELPCPSPDDPCVDELRCNAATGQCDIEVKKLEGEFCDTDENLCTVEECNAQGICVQTELETCESQSVENPCWTYNCQPQQGCVLGAFLEGNSCNDGNACTTTDKCTVDDPTKKLCKGTPVNTDDLNPCTDDSCVGGVIEHNVIIGQVCDLPVDHPCSGAGVCNEDGLCLPASGCECAIDSDCPTPDNLCVGPLVCDQSGSTPVCVPDPANEIQCPVASDQCKQQMCDPTTGNCFEMDAPDGTPCDDNNACTEGDACLAGVCAGPQAVVCDDQVFCNGSEVCDPVTGCQPGTPPDPNDGIDCTLDVCDEALDAITNTPDDAACSDNDVCNGLEACVVSQGGCTGGTPPVIDDGIDCTIDACDPVSGVTHTIDPTFCGDGDVCNGGEACDPAQGGCVTTPAPVIDDGIDCTIDSCDPVNGVTNLPDNSECSDDDVCTGIEVCDPSQGGCVLSVPPPTVNDGIDCTVDACDPVTGVSNTPDDSLCSDNDVCDGIEFCDVGGGGCAEGTPPTVDDGVSCTNDSCDPVNGVSNVPVDANCDDGDACTGVETCDATNDCQAGTPVVCDDGLFCNGAESCDPSDGSCSQGPSPGSDGVACTLDLCDEATQTVLNPDACPAPQTCNLTTGLCEGGGGGLNPSGTWDIQPDVVYTCAFGFLNLNYAVFNFNDTSSSLTVTEFMNGGCQMTGGSAESGTIDVSCLYAGACNEFYELDGTFTDNNTWTGTLCVTFSGTLCFDCASQCFNITAERQ